MRFIFDQTLPCVAVTLFTSKWAGSTPLHALLQAVVVSFVPLPDYRAELDSIWKQDIPFALQFATKDLVGAHFGVSPPALPLQQQQQDLQLSNGDENSSMGWYSVVKQQGRLDWVELLRDEGDDEDASDVEKLAEDPHGDLTGRVCKDQAREDPSLEKPVCSLLSFQPRCS